ncbi:MAG: SCP2 sterol-binding domain-containing protein [Cyclobacteriaceae bacterium]|nr:SCP2 sterol-binding domain-containing protein [Cyclobacteriaceae bacterium SS2]
MMTLEEATAKVSKMAETHGGKFGSKVNFNFKGEGTVHLDDTVSPAKVILEDAEAPCTLVMELDNFEKLLKGDLNPMMAFMTGKMKVEGDKAVAMKLASLF